MATSDGVSVPDFISFLFSAKPKFDCYFMVGNKSLGEPERIGAVKLMMMAHSEVLRAALEDSESAEKGDILVEDIYPDTFKILLKFIYGYDITGDLPFEEADNLFYAAEKYMMPILKKRLAVRLISLLNPDNVCLLLNNPACFTQLELNAAITQILRYETDRVLASPQFVYMKAEGFITILAQDGLAVPEVELWRAAVKWGKQRADSEDGKLLRQHISSFTKLLKICTLNWDQFHQDVVSTEVFSRDEEVLVGRSIGGKRKIDSLTEFCNEIEPRKRLNKSVKFSKGQQLSQTDQQQYKLSLSGSFGNSSVSFYEYSCELVTKKCAIELLPLVCCAHAHIEMYPEGWKYSVNCVLIITRMIGPNTSDDRPLTVTFSGEAEYGKSFDVPLAIDGYNVTLLPNSKYMLKIMITGNHKQCTTSSPVCTNTHISLKPQYSSKSSYLFPSESLKYRLGSDD